MRGQKSPLLLQRMNMIEATFIAKLVNDRLEGTDKFLVQADVKPGNRILVFLDGDHGITIKDCVDISRFIESHLDRDKEDFELNVSSAGLDHPFTLLRQYRKHVGKPVIVKLHDGTKQEGLLEDASDAGILISPLPGKKKKGIPAPGQRLILFAEIMETKSVITFKK
jgi:ribosome maturation factor RimP